MTEQLDQIKATLEAAEAELARVEAAAPAAALRIHTGGAQEGDQELLDRLPELRINVDNLRLAVTGAEQELHDRTAAERQAAADAQKRACRQHIGAIRRAAAEAEAALATAARAFADLQEARRKADATAPAQIRREYVLSMAFAEDRIGRLYVVELGRVLRGLHTQPPRTWVEWQRDFEVNGRVLPLTEIVERYIQRVAPMLTIEREHKSAASSTASIPAEAKPVDELAAEKAAELNETEALIAGELARMSGTAA